MECHLKSNGDCIEPTCLLRATDKALSRNAVSRLNRQSRHTLSSKVTQDHVGRCPQNSRLPPYVYVLSKHEAGWDSDFRLSIMLNTYTALGVTFRTVDAVQRAMAHGIDFVPIVLYG